MHIQSNTPTSILLQTPTSNDVVTTPPKDTADEAWEAAAVAKAKKEMMMGMVTGIIFGVVTLIVCCVMWKLCCGKLCDQKRRKIMPMDFRGADRLGPPRAPPKITDCR